MAKNAEARVMSATVGSKGLAGTAYRLSLLAAGLALIAAIWVLIYVVDPAQSISPDIGKLYAAAATDSTDPARDAIAHGVLWTIVALAVLVGVTVWDLRLSATRESKLAWGRLSRVGLAFGVIACSSIVPWLIVGFALSIVAEDAGLPHPAQVGIASVNLVQLAGAIVATSAGLSIWIRGLVESSEHQKRLQALRSGTP